MQFSRRINFYIYFFSEDAWKQIFAVNCPLHLHPFFIHSSRKKEGWEHFFLCANLMHDYIHIWMLSCAVCFWVHPQTHTHNFCSILRNFSSLIRHRWLLDWWCRFDRFFSLPLWLLLSYYIAIFQFASACCMPCSRSLYNFCCCDCNLKEEIAEERKWIRRPCRNGQSVLVKKSSMVFFHYGIGCLTKWLQVHF